MTLKLEVIDTTKYFETGKKTKENRIYPYGATRLYFCFFPKIVIVQATGTVPTHHKRPNHFYRRQ